MDRTHRVARISALTKRTPPIRRGVLLPLVGISLGWAVAFGAGAAWSHHGFGGRYDLSVPVWIEGEVTSAFFGQPHAELVIAVPRDLRIPTEPDLGSAATFLDSASLTVPDEIVGVSIKVELPPTQQYFGLSDRVAVGDRIAVAAVRNCDPPHQLNGQWLRLADGEIVARAGPMSYMVERC